MTPLILVVEEQPALRAGYARSLRREGYRVVATRPTERVFRLLRQVRPDLIVVDPECSAGRGKAIALEALRYDPSVCLVFNTGRPQLLACDFSSWMADAYAVRSTEVDEIARVVDRAWLRRGGTAPGLGPTRPPALSRVG
jgi:DNA-binding response OmpR family regulator